MTLQSDTPGHNPDNSARRQVWVIAWPMMLSNLSVPLLGLVDTALLGHLPSVTYLAAVALGANFINLVFWSFGFLRMGTTSLISRNAGATSLRGAPETEEIAILGQSLVLAGGCGLAIILLLPPLLPTIVTLLNASPEIAPLAIEYINIRLYAAPAVLVTYTLSGWLIGNRRAKSALALVLTINLANIALDTLFILGFGWNSAGAAWATFIAEYLGLFLALGMLYSYYRASTLKEWLSKLGSTGLATLLTTNGHLMVRTIALLFVLNFFAAQGARLGDNLLAANAILFQLTLLAAYVMDGFSHAAEALCGREVGARNHARFSLYVRTCAVAMLWIAGGFSLLYLLTGNLIVGIFTDLPAVLEVASDYLPWLVVIPLISMPAYLLDAVFIGTGETRVMSYSMCAAALLVFLPVWALTLSWGNTGLWLAFVLFNIARGLSLSWIYWLRWGSTHSIRPE